jgi:putative ABC transport system permease protein
MLLLFLAEATIIGVLGGLGGLALGRVVSWLLEIAVSVYVQSQGIATHLVLFALPVWLYVSALAFATTVSVLAGVYPTIRAARVDPIRALRSE